MSTFPLDPNLPAPTETVAPVAPAIRERVERGAAWLDETKPGWRSLIDQFTLDLDDAEYCVLGQVFANDADSDQSGYGYVLALLESQQGTMSEAVRWSIDHGFDEVGFADLTTAWLRYLDGAW